ncbi:MAG: transglycosylase SLT domain-containing protein [Deltaproteobacteria bacterium]|nr:transglycosylase SLT domain-containing protein [Deltaproteobacteria bacterium]
MSSSSTSLLLSLVLAAQPRGPEGLAAFKDLFGSGDYSGAAAALAVDAHGQRCVATLEPHCAFYRGEGLFWAGRHAEAAAELRAARELDPQGPIAGRALGLEGEALLRSGRAAQAAERLEEAIALAGSSAIPELRLSLAEARATLGDSAGAAAQWKRIFLEHPDHPASKLAKRSLKATGEYATLTAPQLLDRAERLVAAGLPGKALPAIHKAMGLAGSPAERFRAELDLGKALAALKDGEQAEKILREVVVAQAPRSLRIEALLALGRIAMARGAADEAAARLDEVVATFPSDPAADEAAFLSAWTRFNVADYAGCAARFKTFVAQRRSSKRGEDGLWYLGFCSRLAGDLETAEQALSEMERSSGKLAPQALYWRARIARTPRLAEALYRAAVRRAPTGWYAWMAQRRLFELGVAEEPFPLAAAPVTPTATAGLREERAALLARAGLLHDAAAEMGVAAKAVQGAAEAQRLASTCAGLGLHARAYQLAQSRLWGQAYRERDPVALGLLFPRAYPEAVEASAQAVGFDPYFVWAIMRRESAFDPLALSTARAFGLMQLLSPTAAKIAHLAGEPPPSLDSLQRPERIVPLAVWYLAELTGRFGHAGLAAAAYNGGPGAAARWVADRGSAPLDEFVELIPYKETRHYVKGVLGDYFTYRALWSAPGAALPTGASLPAAAAGASF